LSAEIAAKEQLKMVLEQHKMEARQEQETLSMQVCHQEATNGFKVFNINSTWACVIAFVVVVTNQWSIY